jgi:hypothetical protein
MSGQVLEFPAHRMRDREPWRTRREIADHLGVSVRWVDYRIAEGMPSKKLRGARRLRLSEVESWLERRAS